MLSQERKAEVWPREAEVWPSRGGGNRREGLGGGAVLRCGRKAAAMVAACLIKQRRRGLIKQRGLCVTPLVGTRSLVTCGCLVEEVAHSKGRRCGGKWGVEGNGGDLGLRKGFEN